MVNRKRVRRMQIDLKAAEGEIGVNMIIKLSFQIQFINRNEKIGGWSFLILGSSCKSRGTEIYLWTDPACILEFGEFPRSCDGTDAIPAPRLVVTPKAITPACLPAPSYPWTTLYIRVYI